MPPSCWRTKIAITALRFCEDCRDLVNLNDYDEKDDLFAILIGVYMLPKLF